MKAIHWIVTVATIALAPPAPAQAALGDPEVILYRFPGVFDSGNVGFAGTATVFHCTNFSGAVESLRIVIRGPNGDLVRNSAFNISHLFTVTLTTHETLLYFVNGNLQTGLVAQGSGAIAATSTSIICTAMTVDAGFTGPTGIALRGIRFNPVPGSQE